MKSRKNQGLGPISISLSPNTEKDDVQLASKLLFKFGSWKKGKEIEELERKFKNYLGLKHTFSFNSGRSSLMAILDALEIREGDEILIQGFTCNSAIIPLLERGAKPVFVDIDETLNLNPSDLESKITPKSKAVMIQHTFGHPSRVEEILEIARKNSLILIEDCAHSLGIKYRGRFCGTFGDVAFFSLGRDKIISSVFGGMAATNTDKLAGKIKEFKEKLDYPSGFWVFQQLLHPILVNRLILPAYKFPNLGKVLLGSLQRIKVLSKAVHYIEKRGRVPSYFPKKLPNALACLALNQFEKLERFNSHRKEIARFYEDKLKDRFSLPFLGKEFPFLRYPLLVKDSDRILRESRERKILLNDGWRKSPIVPPDTDVRAMGYILGSCRNAEKVADEILNLPTHINISYKEAERITNFLKEL